MCWVIIFTPLLLHNTVWSLHYKLLQTLRKTAEAEVLVLFKKPRNLHSRFDEKCLEICLLYQFTFAFCPHFTRKLNIQMHMSCYVCSLKLETLNSFQTATTVPHAYLGTDCRIGGPCGLIFPALALNGAMHCTSALSPSTL